MSILFEATEIGNMQLKNRFIRSATGDACADELGHVTDRQLELYANLAARGVGFIITGVSSVHDRGGHRLHYNSIAKDEFIPGLSKLTDVAHSYGAKIAMQLFHGGRASAHLLKSSNMLAMAPSYIDDDPSVKGEYRAMKEDEIWEVIHAFGDGAQRARDAGFDAVQLHGAHGFLLSQFLSPFTNRRQDEWGGDLNNRLRLHHEIYRDIRYKIGKDYPVLIKVGVQDGFQGGLEFREGKQAAKLLAEWGFDGLEISLGVRGKDYAEWNITDSKTGPARREKDYEETEFRTNINSVSREAYYRQWCREIKREAKVPVVITGGLRTFTLMEEIISSKDADFIGLCRPLIMEPGIINEWKEGNHHKPACISCNKCVEGLRRGKPLRCWQPRKRPQLTDTI
jgi:2,4-dienoyl-CoA reductase-like NADH-dependent reductase (Old Yellow Enzyme family)